MKYLLFFILGLKKRSKFVIALQDYKSPGEGSSFLTFQKGDLIILEEDSTGETVLNSGWCVGRCERTQEKGDFPAETVYVLPCMSKPPTDVLQLFSIEGMLYFLNFYCYLLHSYWYELST